MSVIIVPKGQKKQLVRQCLTELGVETSFSSAKKWFMKNHKLSLADATFYHVRQDMQKEKRPDIMKLTHEVVSDLTVVDVVKGVKELIAKVGKEEAKKLIDLL